MSEPAGRPGALLGRALLMELRVYESLARAVARRPRIAPGAVGFRYHRPVLTVLIIFIVLSAVEIPILDAIVHRWPALRIVLLVIGIWGLSWMVGLLCAYLTRPHTVGPEGIRVREGLELDVLVTWERFASLRVRTVTAEGIDPSSTERPGRVFAHESARVCAVWIGGETNLELEFEEPTAISLPGRAPKGGEQVVERLRFWADDPEGMLAAVRSELQRAGARAAGRDPKDEG